MIVSFKNKEAFISEIKKSPFISVKDLEEYFIQINDSGAFQKLPPKKKSLDFFNTPRYFHYLEELFSSFKEEVNSCWIIEGINHEKYNKGLITELNLLNNLFSPTTIKNKRILWRTDANIYYNVHYLHGKPITNLEILPFDTVEKISNHFSFQKNILEQAVEFLKSEEARKSKRNYGTSYPYSYFYFEKLDSIGNQKEIQRAKLDFIQALIDKKLIDKNDQQAFWDYFHDRKGKSLIKWHGSNGELSYLIKELVKKKIITDPLRNRSNIIAKIFCDKNGTKYTPGMFHDLHEPTQTAYINQIVGILKCN